MDEKQQYIMAIDQGQRAHEQLSMISLDIRSLVHKRNLRNIFSGKLGRT